MRIGFVHQYGRRLISNLPLSNLHALAIMEYMEQNKKSHEDLGYNHKYLVYAMRKNKVIETGFGSLYLYVVSRPD